MEVLQIIHFSGIFYYKPSIWCQEADFFERLSHSSSDPWNLSVRLTVSRFHLLKTDLAFSLVMLSPKKSYLAEICQSNPCRPQIIVHFFSTTHLIWLVVWNIFYFSIYWKSSSQLTIIFRGIDMPPTSLLQWHVHNGIGWIRHQLVSLAELW